MNLYGYASGDPINNSDPFGLCDSCSVANQLYDAGKRKVRGILDKVGGFGARLRAGANSLGDRMVMSGSMQMGMFAADATATGGGSQRAELTLGASNDAIGADVFVGLNLQEPMPGGVEGSLNYGILKAGVSISTSGMSVTRAGIGGGFSLGRPKTKVGGAVSVPGINPCTGDCDKRP